MPTCATAWGKTGQGTNRQSAFWASVAWVNLKSLSAKFAFWLFQATMLLMWMIPRDNQCCQVCMCRGCALCPRQIVPPAAP